MINNKGIKNYNKMLNFKELTTGEIYKVIPYRDNDNFFNRDFLVSVSAFDLRVLDAVNEALENDRNFMVSIGYKAE